MRIGKIALTIVCLALLCFTTTGAASDTAKNYTNNIGMEFVHIPAGSFMMGPDVYFETSIEDEASLHKVIISKAFYLGKYEVTQQQWETVMDNNPAKFKGRDNPVENVSCEDAQEFVRRLNIREGHNRYRLPTEAEWEYAARAGTDGSYFFGNDANELSGYAWYRSNSDEAPHPVGQKLANAWGLHDVYGNVDEWVQDWYDYYANSPETDPKGPVNGSSRVLRGGCWRNSPKNCRSASRNDLPQDAEYRSDCVGFRLALSLEEQVQ